MGDNIRNYVSVSEVVDIYLGGTPRRSEPEYWGGEIKWASAKDIAASEARYIFNAGEAITNLGLEQSAAKLLDQDTVVITARGTVGAIRMLGEPMSFNQTCYGLVAKDDIIPSFLYYSLKASLLDIQSLSYGTVFDTITTKTFDSLEIPLPPLPEQRAIAHILGTLDDKIELNRRMNETLEGIARAIFKSWFVDFDPVRAKLDGRDTGLPPEIAELFPDGFEDSELGRIPRWWGVSKLSEHITPTKGLSYKGKFLSEDEGLPMHNLNSVFEGGGYKFKGIKFYTGEYKERHKIIPGDIIVTNTEQGFDHLLIGYPAIVPNYFGKLGIFSHHIFRVGIKPKSPLTTHFLYFALMSHKLRGLITGYTNGSTVNMLHVDGLKKPEFVLPPPELIQSFTGNVLPMFSLKEENYEESRTLIELRDTLLPKLMRGELRVGEAR